MSIHNVYLLAAIEACEGIQCREQQLREVFPDGFIDMYGFDFES